MHMNRARRCRRRRWKRFWGDRNLRGRARWIRLSGASRGGIEGAALTGPMDLMVSLSNHEGSGQNASTHSPSWFDRLTMRAPRHLNSIRRCAVFGQYVAGEVERAADED